MPSRCFSLQSVPRLNFEGVHLLVSRTINRLIQRTSRRSSIRIRVAIVINGSEAVFEGIITNVPLNVAVDMAVTLNMPGASFLAFQGASRGMMLPTPRSQFIGL